MISGRNDKRTQLRRYHPAAKPDAVIEAIYEVLSKYKERASVHEVRPADDFDTGAEDRLFRRQIK